MMKISDALHQLPISTKSRRLRGLWPVIEAKLAEGITHGEILRLLNDSGFDLTERTYKSYLYRYRKRHRSSGVAPTPVHLTEFPALQPADVAEGSTLPASVAGEKRQRPPTFEYDPRGISPELLK
jgi:hypothetical protein